MELMLILMGEVDEAEAAYQAADLAWWATAYRSERLGDRCERALARYVAAGRALGELNRKGQADAEAGPR